jgi:hypothetical protein
VFCPRCGTENPNDNRFCVSCGTQLKGAGAATGPRKGIKERALSLIGRSRKERLITGGVVLAIVIAVISLLSLDTDEETPAPSAATDAACANAKRAVAKAATEARGGGSEGVQQYAADVIVALLDFRQTVLEGEPASSARDDLVVDLRQAAIETGGLARLAREGAGPTQLTAQATRIDAATQGVDAASDDLGLTECAEVRIIPAKTG